MRVYIKIKFCIYLHFMWKRFVDWDNFKVIVIIFCWEILFHKSTYGWTIVVYNNKGIVVSNTFLVEFSLYLAIRKKKNIKKLLNNLFLLHYYYFWQKWIRARGGASAKVNKKFPSVNIINFSKVDKGGWGVGVNT